MYPRNTRHINNWDLVDTSAPGILGAWYANRSRAPLRRMARSADLWERRMAMIATLHFIRAGESAEACRIAELLLHDEHDLMHKATGWMLREVGARCGRDALRSFLDRHAASMPRTMLRYAIEHLPAAERAQYMTATRRR
jgi:3-methyladenine DNA glycosylase AlkD